MIPVIIPRPDISRWPIPFIIPKPDMSLRVNGLEVDNPSTDIRSGDGLFDTCIKVMV